MNKHDEFPTKPDYEAKYKALEQAVKDAISEMDTVKDFENYDYRGGMLAAISILHDSITVSLKIRATNKCDKV